MDRRDFVRALGGWTAALLLPDAARAAAWERTLVLVELKGGNDGLNTVVPLAQDAYYRLRPRIAIARGQVLPLDAQTGLHPALRPLLDAWAAGELAILRGLGYPQPRLSHFRSIEIWDSASRSDQYLEQGWIARALTAQPPPARFAADGIVIGSADPGPLSGGRARAIVLSDLERFRRQARFAQPMAGSSNPALAHVMKVEADLSRAAARLAEPARALKTGFPRSAFGNAVRTACEALATGFAVPAVRLTLDGFDTHRNQPETHARLLAQLAEGLVALRSALIELGRWESTLVLTYSEFGRRPRENLSNGTDHGTACAHFALGPRVRGGLHGTEPSLDRLDADGNLAHTLDFRSLYATVLEDWWKMPAGGVLGGRFEKLELIR
ncbi:MAG: DUF1501 domain-containing protein [Rhodocyclaceae bacterium]